MSDDRQFTLTRIMERETSFSWRALMLHRAILDFADMVAKRFRPGSEVAFRLVFDGARLVGKVSKAQMEPNALAGAGLLVECDQDTVEHVRKFAAWRIFDHVGDRVLVLAGWTEIEYQAIVDGRGGA